MRGGRKGRSSATPVPSTRGGTSLWGWYLEKAVCNISGESKCWYFTYKSERLLLSPPVSMTFLHNYHHYHPCYKLFIIQGCAQPDTKLPMVGLSFDFCSGSKTPTKHSRANSCSASAICEASRLFCTSSAASLCNLSLIGPRKTQNN